jgi:hypothetical protein
MSSQCCSSAFSVLDLEGMKHRLGCHYIGLRLDTLDWASFCR